MEQRRPMPLNTGIGRGLSSLFKSAGKPLNKTPITAAVALPEKELGKSAATIKMVVPSIAQQREQKKVKLQQAIIKNETRKIKSALATLEEINGST